MNSSPRKIYQGEDGFRNETTRVVALTAPEAAGKQYDCAPQYMVLEFTESKDEALQLHDQAVNSSVERLHGRSLKKDLVIAGQNVAPIGLGLARLGLMGYGIAKIIAIGGAAPYMLVLMAPGMIMQGNKVLADIRRALKVDPMIRGLVDEAMSLSAVGDFAGAESRLKSALELDVSPDNKRNADLYFTLGQVHVQQGHFRKALLAFAKASVLLKETDFLVQQGEGDEKLKLSKRGWASLMQCACIDSFLSESDSATKEWSEIMRDEAQSASIRFMNFAHQKANGRMWGLWGKDQRSADVNQMLIAKVQFLAAKAELLADPTNQNFERLHQTLADGIAFLISDSALTPAQKVQGLMEQAGFYVRASHQQEVTNTAFLRAGLQLIDAAGELARQDPDPLVSLKIRAFGSNFCKQLLPKAHLNAPDEAEHLREDLKRRYSDLVADLEQHAGEIPYGEQFLYQCCEACYQLTGDADGKQRYMRRAVKPESGDGVSDPILRMQAYLRCLYLTPAGAARDALLDELRADLESSADAEDNSMVLAYLLKYLGGVEQEGEARRELQQYAAQAFDRAADDALQRGAPLPFRLGNQTVLHDARTAALLLLEQSLELALEVGDEAASTRAMDRLQQEAASLASPHWDARIAENRGRAARQGGDEQAALEQLRLAAERYRALALHQDAARVLGDVEQVAESFAEAGETEEVARHMDIEQYRELRKLSSSLIHRMADHDEVFGDGGGKLRPAARRIEDDQFFLAVVGEFSSGKSTFINALIGHDLLPSSAMPTTSKVNILRWGDEPRCKVKLEDGALQEVALDDLSGFVTERGNPGNEKGVAEVTIFYPLDMLRDGLTIIDTPGVGSIVAQHSEITYGLIPYADAVVLLSNSREPYSKTERDFLLKVRDEIGDRLFVLLNKVDTLSEEEIDKVVDFARERLAEDIEEPRVFPLSSYYRLYSRLIARGEIDERTIARKRLLRGISDPEQLDRRSRFAAFYDELMTYLARNKGAITLRQGLGRAQAWVISRTIRLERELNAMEQSQEALAARSREMEGHTRTRMEAINGLLDQIGGLADDSAASLQLTLVADFDQAAEQLASGVETAVAEKQEEEQVKANLASSIQDWIKERAAPVSHQLRLDLEQRLDRVNDERAGLQQDFKQTFESGASSSTDIGVVDIPLNMSNIGNTNLASSFAQLSVGAALGYLGAALFGPIGILVAIFLSGSAGGAISGWFAERQRAKVVRSLREMLPRIAADASRTYGDKAREFCVAVKDQVAAEVAQTVADLEGQIQTWTDNRHRGAEELTLRRQEVQREQASLDKLAQEVRELLARIS